MWCELRQSKIAGHLCFQKSNNKREKSGDSAKQNLQERPCCVNSMFVINTLKLEAISKVKLAKVPWFQAVVFSVSHNALKETSSG